MVEATLKSGTLTTAAHATSQAREVFAIPGNIDNPQSRGCHALLKNGATLVETVADILEVIAPLLPKSVSFASDPKADVKEPPNPDPEAEVDTATRKLLQALSYDPMSLDQLADHSGLDIVTLTKMTLDLELNGTIKKIAGGKFVSTSP